MGVFSGKVFVNLYLVRRSMQLSAPVLRWTLRRSWNDMLEAKFSKAGQFRLGAGDAGWPRSFERGTLRRPPNDPLRVKETQRTGRLCLGKYKKRASLSQD